MPGTLKEPFGSPSAGGGRSDPRAAAAPGVQQHPAAPGWAGRHRAEPSSSERLQTWACSPGLRAARGSAARPLGPIQAAWPDPCGAGGNVPPGASARRGEDCELARPWLGFVMLQL